MNRASRTSRLVLLAIATALAASIPAVASGGSANTLHIKADLTTARQTVTCPSGTTGANPYCYTIEGKGVVPGLGRTRESFLYVIDDQSSRSTLLHFTATITVPTKGTTSLSGQTAKPICPCVAQQVPFNFTVTGGTGAYAGATGGGKVMLEQALATFSGTLTVPGYRFDTSPPVISGALPKTVEARAGAGRARVTYKVSAKDPDEGSLPVSCRPRSGSSFKIGRTTVHCAATDANGNTAKKSFPVTVKRG